MGIGEEVRANVLVLYNITLQGNTPHTICTGVYAVVQNINYAKHSNPSKYTINVHPSTNAVPVTAVLHVKKICCIWWSKQSSSSVEKD